MRKSVHNYELDMTHGKLIPRILTFALPLMLTSILQLLYNAADVIVVGRFAGRESLAAVGATGALINLIVNLFLGLSIGANVVAARAYGSSDFKGTQDTVHTAISVSLVAGVIVGIIGSDSGTFQRAPRQNDFIDRDIRMGSRRNERYGDSPLYYINWNCRFASSI